MKRLYNTEAHKEEVKAALQDGRLSVILLALFFPRDARKFLLRVLCVALGAFILFKFIFLPLVIRGESMKPTYPSRGFLFCFAPAKYLWKPERGDVVIMRYGKGVMLLKRIVGLPGDRIAFKKGVLYRNGKALHEPYAAKPCTWELPERTVTEGNFYLVGDNRSVPMDEHIFGEMSQKYYAGVPLW
jgi:signal peptidase I